MKKLVELEAIRGLAALAVVAAHYIGSMNEQIMHTLLGTPFFLLLNGHAAVSVFFVLSGVVLSLAFFETGSLDTITRAAVKRWFRLALLPTLSVVISCLCFRYGLYHYKEAADVTGSDWLRHFASADPDGDFRASLREALWEGTYGTFFENKSRYNVALWTMYHEFFGSFLTFGLAVLLRYASRVAAIFLVVLMLLMSMETDPRLVAFVAGTTLAYLYTDQFRLPKSAALVILVGGLYLLGYSEPAGLYKWLKQDHSPYRYDEIFVHCIGATLLIGSVLGYPPLATGLRVALLRFLGRISFAVYVIHAPLIFSLCAILAVAWADVPLRTVWIALTCLPVLIGVGWLLTLLDEGWMRGVNQTARLVVPRRSAAHTMTATGRMRPT